MTRLPQTFPVRLPGASLPLRGRVSFSYAPTAAVERFLAYSLAHHPATATVFKPLHVSLAYLFGPLPPDPGALNKLVRWFGEHIPCLQVEEVDAQGQLVHEGSYSFLPLTAFLQHEEDSPMVLAQLNFRLLDYLPQLVGLLLPELPGARLDQGPPDTR